MEVFDQCSYLLHSMKASVYWEFLTFCQTARAFRRMILENADIIVFCSLVFGTTKHSLLSLVPLFLKNPWFSHSWALATFIEVSCAPPAKFTYWKPVPYEGRVYASIQLRRNEAKITLQFWHYRMCCVLSRGRIIYYPFLFDPSHLCPSPSLFPPHTIEVEVSLCGHKAK